MHPIQEFRQQPPAFWALVKLVSGALGYTNRKRRDSPAGEPRIKRYTADDIVTALRDRGLSPRANEQHVDRLVRYSKARGELLEGIEPKLMDRARAAALFAEIRDRVDPPEELIVMNKQKGNKRHVAFLTSIVSMLTYEALRAEHGVAQFNHNPRGPLTFARDGMPLRTLFRWMDGAYPDVNAPVATWEIKEYYGTKTFGSRVADGVYETALDGYELNDLRSVGVEVEHYLFLDDYFTWWECGRSYLCRIVDMLHADLLDGAFFGSELVDEWPRIVRSWPAPSPAQ